MNTKTDAGEDGHAKYSPSKLGYLERCPKFVRREQDQENEMAVRGTLMHKALETGDDSALTEDECELVAWCRESSDTFVKERLGKVLITTKNTEVRLDTGVPGVYGTADVLLDAGKSLVLIDFKTGKHLQDDVTVNAQINAYAYAALLAYPKAEVVHCAILYPRQRYIDRGSLHRNGLEEARLRIMATVARVKEPTAQPVPGPKLCEYCGNFGGCPAVVSKYLPLAKLAVMKSQDFPPVVREADQVGIAYEQIQDPVMLSKLRYFVEVFCKWGEGLKTYTNRLATTGVEFPGYHLARRNGERKIDDLWAAKEVLTEYGIDDVTFLGMCKLPIGEVEHAISATAPRGQKSKRVTEAMTKLIAADAVSSYPGYSFLEADKDYDFKSLLAMRPDSTPAHVRGVENKDGLLID